MGRPPSRPVPETALDVLAKLAQLAEDLTLSGWEVNLGVEGGNGRESITFSAARPPKVPLEPK